MKSVREKKIDTESSFISLKDAQHNGRSESHNCIRMVEREGH